MYQLISANEENTFNINDLWVSAAVAQDTAVFDEDETDDEALENTAQAPTPSSAGVARRSTRVISSGFRHRASSRRFSTASGLPGFFSNTGLAQPEATSEDPFVPGLSVIAERPAEADPIAARSGWAALPLLMISQYGLLALHGTTHDQLFLSFLVT